MREVERLSILGEFWELAGTSEAKEAEEFGSFAESALHHGEIGDHFAEHPGDRARAEVVAAVELFEGGKDFFAGEVGVFERGRLLAVAIDELAVGEPAIFEGLAIEFCAWVGGGEADLDGKGIDFFGELDGFADGFAGFPWQAEDESTVDGDAEFFAIGGELAGFFEADALFDLIENFLIAAFVADKEEAQPVVAHGF